MKKQRQIPGMMKRRRFTLVEMTVAMSIFAILMLIMMQLFGSIQTIWRTSNHKATASEDARFVTRLIKDMLETPSRTERLNAFSIIRKMPPRQVVRILLSGSLRQNRSME